MIIALLTRLQCAGRGVGLQSNRGIGLPLWGAGEGGATLPAAATSMCGVVLKIIANYVKRQPLQSQLAGVLRLLLLLLCPTHRFGSAPDTPLKRLTYNLRGRQSKVKVASLWPRPGRQPHLDSLFGLPSSGYPSGYAPGYSPSLGFLVSFLNSEWVAPCRFCPNVCHVFAHWLTWFDADGTDLRAGFRLDFISPAPL